MRRIKSSWIAAMCSLMICIFIHGITAGPVRGEVDKPDAVKQLQKGDPAPAAAPGKQPLTPQSGPHESDKKSPSESNAGSENNENDEETSQFIMDEALALLEESQEYWVKGDIEQALELLDRAYGLVLEADGRPDITRQKDDLRLLIAKRILTIYNSLQTYTKGPRGEIPMIMNEDVEREIRLFQTRERDFFIRAYQNSGLYRPYIVNELKKSGLPEELSWLPLVESGFKITALSPARALGMWQFIPSTGYKYGLNRDEWVDERMDMEKSTRGAIEYLKALHGMFGDWLTVLAAYNCGEGRVLRVISRQRLNYLDHFWDLYRQLPSETARYVPRFLATLHIVKDPQKFGMDLGRVLEKPLPYETAKTNKPMKLQDIATRIDVPEETLAALNPELRLRVTPNREYELRLPLEKAEVLVNAMDNIPQWEKPKRSLEKRRVVIRHRVKTGESLASIARRYATSINTIRSYNKIGKAQGVAVGQRLMIPVRMHSYAAEMTDRKTKKSEASDGSSITRYRVKKGDTLHSVAQRFNTTILEIKQLNRMKGDTLKVGQVIKINNTDAEETKEPVKKKGPARKKVAEKKINQD